MTTRKIGLKLANGEFYPVLDEDSVARRRLVVTTVQDGQRSVQIDIYRGEGPTVAGAEYAGSLVIDNIPFAPKGEPDIRVDLGLDAEGRLTAYAEELSSGEHQSLEVSLKALDEEDSYEVPDFAFGGETDSLPEEEGGREPSLLAAATEIRESEGSLPDFSIEEEEESPAAPVEDTGLGLPDFDFGTGEEETPAEEGESIFTPESSYSGAEIVGAPAFEEKKRGKPLLPVILFVVLALAVVLGGAWLVYRYLLQPKTGTMSLSEPAPVTAPVQEQPAAVPVQPAPAAATPAPTAQPAPAPVTPAPAAPAPKAASGTGGSGGIVSAEVASRPARKPGVNYKLRWGDTLWDLSYTYYRNPWLYRKISTANKIKNPDHIIAGRTIWIPPLK